MLFLLDKDVRTVKWNGTPLHEASSAIVKEETNGDFTLTVRYPITDTGIYQLIKEDMLIKAPVPVLGAQLFRIKKPIENDDSLDITAYHISDDIMKRSITPVSVVGQGCAMALSQMVQNAKTGLGDFSFTSDIMDSRTFNTTETETLYSVLMDGKHSIVGTWEGELVRDNFALSIKRSRGVDRGVVITTHKNLKSYQRTKNSHGVVTRIHAKSTFRDAGSEEDTVLMVTVDSPLIHDYPYINEREYENNNAKTVEELRKWAEAKFKHEGIDKVSDAIEIEAYELDGQVVHLGDTVNLKSRKHSADLYKKAIAYEFNALTEEYISITFDDKPGAGGSGVSAAVEAILGATKTAEDRSIDKAIANANAAFEAEFDKAKQAIEDGIEEAKAAAEVVKAEIGAEVEVVAREGQAVKQAVDAELAEADRKAKAFESDVRNRVGQVETKANQVAEQARQADQKAAQALTKAGASESLAQTAKDTADRAIRQAGDNLRTAQERANQLQADLDTTKRTITSQARDILAQAQAQSELTTRLQTVETTANGTKTTVTELSKSLNTATGNLASVTQRVASTEAGLTNVRDQYSQLSQTVSGQSGQITAVTRQTADLQRGLDGVTERFETAKIGTQNLVANSKINESSNVYGFGIRWVNLIAGRTYWLVGRAKKTGGTAEKRTRIYLHTLSWNEEYVLEFGTHDYEIKSVKFTARHTERYRIANYWYPRDGDRSGTADIDWVMVTESDLAPTTWSAADEDIRQELATYIRTATENTSRLEQSIQTADGKAEGAKTLAQQTARGLELKAEKTAVDAATSRLTTAESTIRQHADQIAQRLTSTQVETAITAKGYQTKAQVDANITGRGYITNAALAGYVPTTSFDNYKIETAQAIERGLTATRALIPSEVSHRNLAVGSFEHWNDYRPIISSTNWSIDIATIKLRNPSGIYPGTRVNYLLFISADDIVLEPSISNPRLTLQAYSNLTKWHWPRPLLNSWERPLRAGNNYHAIKYHEVMTEAVIGNNTEYTINIRIDGAKSGRFHWRAVMVTTGDLAPQYWSPAPEDMVTSVDFNRVEETAQLYERVIGRSEGDIQTNVARQVLTSQLYQTEVKSPLADLATRLTQLNDSYAIQVLGSSSRILTEINANASGLRLAGKLIHLDGTVTASDAFFKSVMADKIEAGNIKAGAVTTAKIAAGAVTADHLLVNQAMIDKLVTNSVWADRLFAQSAFMAKLQATKILAGQIDAGLINTAMLATDSVTADKLVVNQALFTKLMANEAYLRQLFAKQAFITQVQSVELSASRIKSGILQAINGAMSVNLDSGQILYYTDQAALKRILSGYPTQFIKFATGNVDGKGPAGVTVIGSNRDGSESSNNGGFVGIRAWNGPNVDSLDLVGDEIRLASSAYDSSDGWDVTTLPGRLVIEPHRSVDRTTARIGVGDVRIFYNNTTYVSLVSILDRIFDNFRNLNNNGNYQRNFYDTWK